MRLNALHPSDNPMEELLFCFGGDDSGGDSGGAGGSAGDFEGTNFGGDTATAGGSLSGGGGDSGGDAFDASGDYVSQSIASFQSPSVGVMATPMQAATGQAGFSPSAPSFGGFDNDNDGIPNSIDAMPNTPNVTAPSMSFAPNLINQPLAVGSKVAVMPYESYQRSPQQMFGYGGLTASPYAPSQISFQGGAPAGTYNPLGGAQISQFDMGRAPTPAGTPDDRNFLERAFDAIGGRSYANQRAGVFDPRTGTFQQFDGQTTLEKTSDNVLGDFFGNAVAGALGVTPLVGRLDTKEYTPLAGGERLQYSTSSGGLLSDMIGEQLIPYSELEARQAQMGGDGGSDQPLIIPQEVAEVDPVTGEPTAFPAFTPRQFEYEPYVGKFYTIPSRFTKPYGLLG